MDPKKILKVSIRFVLWIPDQLTREFTGLSPVGDDNGR